MTLMPSGNRDRVGSGFLSTDKGGIVPATREDGGHGPCVAAKSMVS